MSRCTIRTFVPRSWLRYNCRLLLLIFHNAKARNTGIRIRSGHGKVMSGLVGCAESSITLFFATAAIAALTIVNNSLARRRPCYACVFSPCSDDCGCEKFVTELPEQPTRAIWLPVFYPVITRQYCDRSSLPIKGPRKFSDIINK